MDEEHRGHVLMQSGVNPGFAGPEEYVIWKPCFRKHIQTYFCTFYKTHDRAIFIKCITQVRGPEAQASSAVGTPLKMQ